MAVAFGRDGAIDRGKMLTLFIIDRAADAFMVHPKGNMGDAELIESIEDLLSWVDARHENDRFIITNNAEALMRKLTVKGILNEM